MIPFLYPICCTKSQQASHFGFLKPYVPMMLDYLLSDESPLQDETFTICFYK